MKIFTWLYNAILAVAAIMVLAIIGAMVYASAVALYLAAIGAVVVFLIVLIIKEYRDTGKTDRTPQH
jgi:low affinity Fe/Cu permease